MKEKPRQSHLPPVPMRKRTRISLIDALLWAFFIPMTLLALPMVYWIVEHFFGAPMK